MPVPTPSPSQLYAPEALDAARPPVSYSDRGESLVISTKLA